MGDLVDVVGGGTPSTSIKEYWNGNINWFTPSEIGNTTYVSESSRFITEKGLNKSSAKILPANKTILFTSRASIGDVAILLEDSATNQGFQNLIVKDNSDVFFIYCLSPKIKYYAIRHSSGSTFLEISGKELAKMLLYAPNLSEQEKISQLLLKLDKLITLEQEKLNTIKEFRRFLFENILPKENEVNPNIRLSNYEKNWISIDLNKCGKFLKGKGYKKEDVNYSTRASHPIVLYGHLFTDYKPIIKEWNYTAVTLDDNSVYSKPGDVILPSSSTTADNSIVVASSIIKPNIILGGDINIIRTGDVHLSTLIAYIISNTYLKNKIYKTVEGITIRHLYLENLKNIKIKLPSEKQEQELICNTLLKVDNMLLLHKNKVSKLQSLKQFLLNQLFI